MNGGQITSQKGTIYGQSPIQKALHQIASQNRIASSVIISQRCYNDIQKLKKHIKRPKSDIKWIKKHWPITKMKPISLKLSLMDIDFIEMIRQNEQAIYTALGIPKEALKP